MFFFSILQSMLVVPILDCVLYCTVYNSSKWAPIRYKILVFHTHLRLRRLYCTKPDMTA